MFQYCGSLLIPTSILTLLVLWYLLKLIFPKPKVGDFSNKYVLITGCDSGFGKTTAIRLDQMGFHVIAGCLTREGKANFQTVCSDRLVSVLMDVTDSKQIRKVFVQVKNIVADKGVWAVINNAGYMTIGPLEWFTMKDYKKMADVNLWGLIEVTKTFLPLVKKAEGRIVNFASIAGLISYPGFAPYSVTKYGVEAFSDALRREMVQWKVKVSILEPQAFKTPLWTEISGKKLTSLWDGLTDEIKKEYGEDYLAKLRMKVNEIFNKDSSPNTELVVDAVLEAVTSRDPAPRYLIGPMAIVVAVFALMPTPMQDYFTKY